MGANRKNDDSEARLDDDDLNGGDSTLLTHIALVPTTFRAVVKEHLDLSFLWLLMT